MFLLNGSEGMDRLKAEFAPILGPAFAEYWRGQDQAFSRAIFCATVPAARMASSSRQTARLCSIQL